MFSTRTHHLANNIYSTTDLLYSFYASCVVEYNIYSTTNQLKENSARKKYSEGKLRIGDVRKAKFSCDGGGRCWASWVTIGAHYILRRTSTFSSTSTHQPHTWALAVSARPARLAGTQHASSIWRRHWYATCLHLAWSQTSYARFRLLGASAEQATYVGRCHAATFSANGSGNRSLTRLEYQNPVHFEQTNNCAKMTNR